MCPTLTTPHTRMGAIISKLCCGCCIPKKKSKLRTRIPSLIIERSQLTTNDELSEITQYTRKLEKDFEVQKKTKTKSDFLFKSTSVETSVNKINGDETHYYDYNYKVITYIMYIIDTFLYFCSCSS